MNDSGKCRVRVYPDHQHEHRQTGYIRYADQYIVDDQGGELSLFGWVERRYGMFDQT